MATEDAKLRKEIQFLTSLIKQHKTSNHSDRCGTDYSDRTKAKHSLPSKKHSHLPKNSLPDHVTAKTQSTQQITKLLIQQPSSRNVKPTKPTPNKITKIATSERNQFRWVAGSGRKSGSSHPPGENVGKSNGSQLGMTTGGQCSGQIHKLVEADCRGNGRVPTLISSSSIKSSGSSPSKVTKAQGKPTEDATSTSAPVSNLFKVVNKAKHNGIAQVSRATETQGKAAIVSNTALATPSGDPNIASFKLSKYQLINYSAGSPRTDLSPSVSPVRPGSNTPGCINLSRNPSFLGSPYNSPTSSPMKSNARVRHTSTPKESLSPARSDSSLQSRYKLVKTVKQKPNLAAIPTRGANTIVQSRYKFVKRNSSGQLKSSANKGQVRGRTRTNSFSKPKILTRYKLIKSLPELSTTRHKLYSSNKLVKRAMIQAHKHKKNNLSWRSQHGKGRSHQRPGSETWVKKYSLKREQSEKTSVLSVNQLLGRSVTDVSKNKYKFIKGGSRKPADRFKVNNKQNVSPRQQQLFARNKRYSYRPVLSRSKLKFVRKRPYSQQSSSPFHTSKNSRYRFSLNKSERKAHWKDRSSSLSWSRFSHGNVTFSNSIMKLRASYVLKRSVYTAAKSKLRQQKPAKQFCLFFNRFGRCKRGDQCSNIHDPDRVAVCTRFLRGTCKITDCPFSHKVAKEKMPVCSFFLRGVCNRDNCPYLHVNVSKSAELCQDFAKGYCALGERCKKKHLLVCPDFKRDGKCIRGKECFLQHRRKMTKRKMSESATRNEKAPPTKGPATSNRPVKISKRGKAAFDDGDDVNLPLKERKLPSFIALESSNISQVSSTESSISSLNVTAPQGVLGKKGIFPSFLKQGK